MLLIVFFTALVLANAQLAESQISGVKFLSDSVQGFHCWESAYGYRFPSKKGAIIPCGSGDTLSGLRIKGGRGVGEIACFVRMPFTNRSTIWQRFYLVIDSVMPFADQTVEERLYFVTYSVNERFYGNKSLPLVSLYAVRNIDGEYSLQALIRPSAKITRNFDCNAPLTTGKKYCIESMLSFWGADSAEFSLFIDGVRVGLDRFVFTNPITFFEMRVANSTMGASEWNIKMYDIAISDKRLHSIPSAPEGLIHSVKQDSVVLLTDKFMSTYQHEYVSDIEWELYSALNPVYPVIRLKSSGALESDSMAVPFYLDAGHYWFRVRRINNFGVVGEWSNADSFSIAYQREKPAIIKDAYFSGEKADKRAEFIRRDVWYCFNLKLEKNTGWNTYAYAIVNVHHKNFCYGGPMNKGGPFVRDSNIVFNLSLFGGNAFFEKNREGSHYSEKIIQGSVGKFIDATEGKFSVDSTNGVVKLRVRLPDGAVFGTWGIRCFVFDTSGNMSNFYMDSVVVKEPYPVSLGLLQRRLIVSFGLFFLILIGIYYAAKKGRWAKKSVEEKEFSDEYIRICNFLRENISEKNRAEDVYKALKIGKNRFYQIMKSNEAEYSKLLNTLKVEKAKQIMQETDKNISEISFEIGYNNSAYFAKVFKEIVGIAPNEFIKQIRK